MADAPKRPATPAKAQAPTPAPAARPRYVSPFESLRGEIDEAFDRMLGGWPFGRRDPFERLPVAVRPFAQAPKAEMTETDKAYTVTVELPGIDDKDVHVSLDGDYLTIKGEKKIERTDEKTHFTERSYGAFERVFELPEDADGDHVEATSAKGVLTLTSPKLATPPSKGRRIEVKSG